MMGEMGLAFLLRLDGWIDWLDKGCDRHENEKGERSIPEKRKMGKAFVMFGSEI